MQAVQIAPSSVKAHYRLAQAHFHLEEYQLCQDACKAALQIKPEVTQLQQLLQMAESMMRGCFMTKRISEVDQAVIVAHQASIQQVGQQLMDFANQVAADPSRRAMACCRLLIQAPLLMHVLVWLMLALMTVIYLQEEECQGQQQLQSHVAQNKVSASAGRRQADARQTEDFLHWQNQDHKCHTNCHHNNVYVQDVSADESYQLLDLEVGATMTDIRSVDAALQYSLRRCYQLVLLFAYQLSCRQI